MLGAGGFKEIAMDPARFAPIRFADPPARGAQGLSGQGREMQGRP